MVSTISTLITTTAKLTLMDRSTVLAQVSSQQEARAPGYELMIEPAAQDLVLKLATATSTVSVGRVTVAESRALNESTLTPDTVIRRISNLYLSGMQRCYAERMRDDPAARGTLELSFTIDPTGRVANALARGVSNDLDECVTSRMKGWVFPQPSAATNFSLNLQLAPE